MDSVVEFLRPIFSRIVGAWVAALAVWLGAHFGVVLTPTDQEKIITGFIVAIFAIGQTLYAIVHRAIDIKVNPADAATRTLAASGKEEQQALKEGVGH